MNLITFEEYLEYQVRVAACINSNLPDYIAEKSKNIVDKILELNNTKVSQHVPAKELYLDAMAKKQKEENGNFD